MSKTDDGFHKPGTKDGVLPQLYARSKFNISGNAFLNEHPR